METSARYVWIGAVTVLAILAGLGFFLWLAKAELDSSYTQYDILFDSVEGLGQASAVRFNGVDVGQVLDIDLNRANPSQVRVRIEVRSGTPVRLGTMATMQSQGVTGVSFVGLEGGFPDAPLLALDPVLGVAVIPSQPSVVQGLMQDTPDLIKEAIALMKDVRAFTNDENLKSLTEILNNVEAATARLDTAMSDFSRITDSVSKAADQVTTFAGRLDKVATTADQAMTTANETMNSIDKFATTALPQVSGATTDAKRLIEQVTRLVARIDRDPARFFLGNRTPEYK